MYKQKKIKLPNLLFWRFFLCQSFIVLVIPTSTRNFFSHLCHSMAFFLLLFCILLHTFEIVKLHTSSTYQQNIRVYQNFKQQRVLENRKVWINLYPTVSHIKKNEYGMHTKPCYQMKWQIQYFPCQLKLAFHINK